MKHARGSFGYAVVPGSDEILVAGGGSRHAVFGAAGSRMNSVERYDIGKNEWVELERLPGMRAGCVGFFVEDEERSGFWVIGGYGEERTIGGVFPVDEYCRDAVVMDGSFGKWREVGNMWEQGERVRVGKIVAVQDDNRRGRPAVFMLDGNDILRYFLLFYIRLLLTIVKDWIEFDFTTFSEFLLILICKLGCGSFA